MKLNKIEQRVLGTIPKNLFTKSVELKTDIS